MSPRNQQREEMREVQADQHTYAPLAQAGSPPGPGDRDHESKASPAEPDVDELLCRGEDLPIDKDVYGAAIWSIIFDMGELLGGEDQDGLGFLTNAIRMSFVVIVLLTNYFLQTGMLYWFYWFVAKPSVHVVQDLYQKYHAEVYENGEFSQHIWDTWPHKEELCGVAFSNYEFMFAILFLWWTTMVNELRKNERLHRTIGGIPWTADPAKMVVYKKGEDGEPNTDQPRIMALTTTVRCMVYTCVIAPKVFVSLLLLIIGTVWLSATDSFADLVLNAIALEFVIHIDELLFEAMLPASIVSGIESTMIWKAGKEKSVKEKDEDIKKGYKRSAYFFFGTALGVWAYMDWGQSLPLIGVFPRYRNDAYCPVYWHDATIDVCEPFKDCFPFSGASGSEVSGMPGDAAAAVAKNASRLLLGLLA